MGKDWGPVKEDLARLEKQYQPLLDTRPRPAIVRLIVWLGQAIAEVETLRQSQRRDHDPN